MANQWLRLWHDMPNDPKWRTISRLSGQPVSLVLGVYLHILVNASNAGERGRTHNLFAEDLASALDVDSSCIDDILTNMQGRVLEGDMVTGWEKRQPAREDGSAARAKAWRNKKKLEAEILSQDDERNRTQPNAEERPDKDTDTDKNKNTTSISDEIDPISSDDQGKSKSKIPSCPYQQILDAYHETLPELPRIEIFNDARKSKIKAIWNSHESMRNVEKWKQFFQYIRKSDFLMGRTDRNDGHANWKPNLEWLVKPSNFAKIIEKHYHRTPSNAP